MYYVAPPKFKDFDHVIYLPTYLKAEITNVFWDIWRHMYGYEIEFEPLTDDEIYHPRTKIVYDPYQLEAY